MKKRRLLVTCAALLVVVVASGAAALFSQDRYPQDYSQAAHTVSQLSGPGTFPTEPDYLYIIREYDGYVAVFARGESSPEMVLERMVHHLPAYDRIQLQEGVPVFTQEELQERIEDYTS